ncbi:guanosine-3',5'-bis(diphosphate) 3'-pyrophosphohydrolase MESH1-like [Saccostrea echinata]|uniref:guanosine-3',5'-bis(diphosphate) 3'-pyrophosphohydrolase MESH1-like n=1 Tax=Saccostrea echinata TaxID=191078 RepID=UPI002A82D5A5|nr:guanosine-3',5'-bis(diphosphate) 3'-pyrophosphohydrolase MESH1-like [Saccostrea echinata]
MSAVSEIIRCSDFAAIKHKDQRRKDKEKTPYINHPIGVANILTQEAGITDVAVIQAALLHDTVEDTNTTFEELLENFGEEVTGLVREVTDDKNLPKLERKQKQIDHAPHASYKAKLVKLADKLYNLRDLNRCTPLGWQESRVTEYFQWAKKVVDGLRGTNQAMENSLDELFKERNII